MRGPTPAVSHWDCATAASWSSRRPPRMSVASVRNPCTGGACRATWRANSWVKGSTGDGWSRCCPCRLWYAGACEMASPGRCRGRRPRLLPHFGFGSGPLPASRVRCSILSPRKGMSLL